MKNIDIKILNNISINIYSACIHLSLFFGYIHFILPIIIVLFLWLYRKKESDYIDSHGISVLNFIISALIYSFIILILSPFLLVFFGGILGDFSYSNLINTGILLFITKYGIDFVILFLILKASYKAYTNNFWEYPLCFRIIK